MFTYIAAATLLLTTACNGENLCHPGYQTGRNPGITRTTVGIGGTQEEVAARHGTTVDNLLYGSDLEENQNINRGDKICFKRK